MVDPFFSFNFLSFRTSTGIWIVAMKTMVHQANGTWKWTFHLVLYGALHREGLILVGF